jgi:molybdenum cofactor guanylyltransferase
VILERSDRIAVAPLRKSCTGVILAGGRSSRFGGAPKGLARIGGERIIDRVARALRASTDALLLAANDPAAEGWVPGALRVADRTPGLGALGGLQAAMAHAGTPLLVVAWDMPFVSASLLRELRARGERGALGVVPEGPDGRPEPLCAWYSNALLPRIERLLAAGERRAMALADGYGIERIAQAAVAEHGDPALIFDNVNTVDDLRRAEARLRDE